MGYLYFFYPQRPEATVTGRVVITGLGVSA